MSETYHEFHGFRQFANVLIAKMFMEYSGIIIIGHVIIPDNGKTIGMMDVASLLLARQYLSNSGIPNHHVDMVASISGRHFVALQLTHLVRTNSISFVVSWLCIIVVSHNSRKF